MIVTYPAYGSMIHPVFMFPFFFVDHAFVNFAIYVSYRLSKRFKLSSLKPRLQTVMIFDKLGEDIFETVLVNLDPILQGFILDSKHIGSQFGKSRIKFQAGDGRIGKAELFQLGQIIIFLFEGQPRFDENQQLIVAYFAITRFGETAFGSDLRLNVVSDKRFERDAGVFAVNPDEACEVTVHSRERFQIVTAFRGFASDPRRRWGGDQAGSALPC